MIKFNLEHGARYELYEKFFENKFTEFIRSYRLKITLFLID